MTFSLKYSSAFYAALVLLLVTPALAQLPVPKTKDPASVATTSAQQNSSAPVATVPDFDSEKKAPPANTYTDTLGRVLSTVTGYPADMTVEQYQEVQKSFEPLRKIEEIDGGYRWIPWTKAGSKVWEFVYERNPKLRVQVQQGLEWFLDIAVADVDNDKQPDIIVWNHAGCRKNTAPQCVFTIYYGNKAKRNDTYVAETLRPYEDGIILDGEGYYGQ